MSKKSKTTGITIRMLYELALKNEVADIPIEINYECNDSQYDYSGILESYNLYIDKNKIVIDIKNY